MRLWREVHRDSELAAKRAKYHANAVAERARGMEFFRRSHPLTLRECPTCGIEFMPRRRNSQRYCTPECQNRHRWGSRVPVHYHIRRRVLARDGWRCYLCTRPIDPALRWPHELSGTVDHVIPYSVCQHNRPDNLRATHWRCNYDKGDSLPGTEVWVPI